MQDLRARLTSRLRVLDELLSTNLDEYFGRPGSEGAREQSRELLERYVETVKHLLAASPAAEPALPLATVVMDVPVWVVDESDGSTEAYVVVGPDEGDTAQGQISCLSPLGLALLLKRVEERVAIQAPGGTYVYRIAAVGERPPA